MNFHSLRAELAVMSILNEHRIAPTAALPLTLISSAWRRYGLRAHDLPRAVGRLETLGMIRRDRKDGHHRVVLTDAGAEWLVSLRGSSSMLLLIPRYLRHLAGQLLGHRQNPANCPRRRGTDGPPPET